MAQRFAEQEQRRVQRLEEMRLQQQYNTAPEKDTDYNFQPQTNSQSKRRSTKKFLEDQQAH